MLTIEQSRKILGKVAQKMTDKQIEELQNQLVFIADISIDTSIAKRKARVNKNEYGNTISRP